MNQTSIKRMSGGLVTSVSPGTGRPARRGRATGCLQPRRRALPASWRYGGMAALPGKLLQTTPTTEYCNSALPKYRCFEIARTSRLGVVHCHYLTGLTLQNTHTPTYTRRKIRRLLLPMSGSCQFHTIFRGNHSRCRCRLSSFLSQRFSEQPHLFTYRKLLAGAGCIHFEANKSEASVAPRSSCKV